jgi:predicted nucleic acid-binding protein
VKYLLDVNALIAWRHASANGYAVFHAWAKTEGFGSVATCANTELGFLRVSMQVFRLTLAEAQAALADMKQLAGGYVPAAPSPRLAPWATTAAKTSDAYLMQLAAAAGLKLATFDASIPGATLIR